MAIEFKLPDIGEGVAEGEIVRWLVQEGADVKEDQPLVEVMTDKATVEITSPGNGRIEKIFAKEGETVAVGKVIVVIGDGGSAAGPATTETPRREAQAPKREAPKHEPPPRSREAPPAVRPTEAPRSVSPPVREEPTRAEPVAVESSAPGGLVLAAPATRKLARELNVDLGQVLGSGPRGRVTPEDVRKFEEQRRSAPRAQPAAKREGQDRPLPVTPPPLPSSPPGALEERIPVRGVRKRIAEAMRMSKSTAAHFTYVDEVDVTDLVTLRAGARDIGEKRGVKVTYLPFIMKAILSGLREFPMLNAAMDDQRSEIVVKRYYNFGVAVDTDQGLIVPVVKEVDRKSILRLAQDIQELAERARSGKSRLEDLQGGTFTITNAGNIGGLFATPVINYPEVAIVGVHKIAKRPVVKDGQIVVRDIMYLSISLDHRVVDGATGARFMNHVIKFLEDPKLLLLESI